MAISRLGDNMAFEYINKNGDRKPKIKPTELTVTSLW